MSDDNQMRLFNFCIFLATCGVIWWDWSAIKELVSAIFNLKVPTLFALFVAISFIGHLLKRSDK